MRKRLPLLGLPRAAEPAGFWQLREEARLGLARGSVGLADTSSGLLAAEFAVQLADALARAGTGVALVLLGYQGIPALPGELARQLAAGDGTPGSRAAVRLLAYGIDADAEPALPSGLMLQPDEATLWVGSPALCSFAPTLALLLGADRPLSQWPEPLRARRSRCALELSQNRPGLALALAAALNEHGFLPRR